jgi:hypothetical protein
LDSSGSRYDQCLHKRRGISWLTERLLVFFFFFSRTTLLRGVSEHIFLLINICVITRIVLTLWLTFLPHLFPVFSVHFKNF